MFEQVIYEFLRFYFLAQSPPHIVKQPNSAEILFQVVSSSTENDRPFVIECEAEGEPSPRYVNFYIYIQS